MMNEKMRGNSSSQPTNQQTAKQAEELEKLLENGDKSLPVKIMASDDKQPIQPDSVTSIDIKEDKEEWNMDRLLGFGMFHHIQIWISQAAIAIIGAFSYFQLVYMLQDPPGWYCQNGEEKCPKEGEPCEGGNVMFNTTHQNFLHSLPVEHEWVCDKEVWTSNVLSIQGFGMILNSLVFGQLCDKWGRATVMHITNIIFIIVRIISLFVTDSYYGFMATVILAAGFFPVGARAGYTLMAEYCTDEGRKYALISGWVWWVVGMTIIPFVAEALHDWFTFGLVTTLANLILVVGIPLIPESPMLLVSQGKYKRASKIISQIRRINGDSKIENLEEVLKKIGSKGKDENGEEIGMISVFKIGVLRRLTLCMCVLYITNDFFYYASQLNAVNLAGNVFQNYALLALTELPSVFVGQLLVDKIGRRASHLLFMSLTIGCFILNMIFLTAGIDDTSVLVFSIIARVLSNIAWFIMWVQSIEVFPTIVRNTGINISSLVAMAVCMSAPYVIDLAQVDKRYPYLVFTLIGFCGLGSIFLIPETKGIALPQNLGDVERMFKRMRYFDFRPWLQSSSPEEVDGLPNGIDLKKTNN